MIQLPIAVDYLGSGKKLEDRKKGGGPAGVEIRERFYKDPFAYIWSKRYHRLPRL